MTIDTILQLLVYGVTTGSLYGLGAIGVALVFGVMNVLQISHGSLIMLGAFMAFWLFELLHFDPLLSLPLIIIAFFFVGIGLYRSLFSSIAKLPIDLKINQSVLIAFGLVLIIDNIATLVWTANVRTITTPYNGITFGILGVRIPVIGLTGLILAIILIFLLNLFLRRTYLGKSIRATAQDWEAASLMGIRIHQTYAISFAIATALAAVAGVLVILSTGVDTGIGMSWTIKSLIVTVFAGTGNIGGIFACGLIFGILESIGSIFLGPYKELIGLVLFLLVLIWKPQGLFGKGTI